MQHELNDFTGANDYYDLWAFDEFHEPNEHEIDLSLASIQAMQHELNDFTPHASRQSMSRKGD
jgi:hypothetical protein